MTPARKDGPKNYVTLIKNGQVRVEGVTNDFVESLKRAGIVGLTAQSELVIRCPDDNQALGTILSSLLDNGAVFSGGHGWAPYGVFEDLRDKGIVQGEFVEIWWRGPNDWLLYRNRQGLPKELLTD